MQNDCNYVNINSVPTKLSQLVNDRNFASKDEVPKYTTELSNDAQFTNDVDLAKKVDKESGKGLSTNDYTNEDKYGRIKIDKVMKVVPCLEHVIQKEEIIYE